MTSSGENSLRPLGVFWDIENCRIPRGKSAIAVCEKIRSLDFFRGHSEIQFAVVCDATREATPILDELHRAQVDILHVNSNRKNAADDKLKELMRRFTDLHGKEARVILISGDMDFASDIADFKRRKCIHVLLIHPSNAPEPLINAANENIDFQELMANLPLKPEFQGLPFNNRQNSTCLTSFKSQPSPLSQEMMLTNLPSCREQSAAETRDTILQLLKEFQGNLEKFEEMNGCAYVRFPNAELAKKFKQKYTYFEIGERKMNVHYRIGEGHNLQSTSIANYSRGRSPTNYYRHQMPHNCQVGGFVKFQSTAVASSTSYQQPYRTRTRSEGGSYQRSRHLLKSHHSVSYLRTGNPAVLTGTRECEDLPRLNNSGAAAYGITGYEGRNLGGNNGSSANWKPFSTSSVESLSDVVAPGDGETRVQKVRAEADGQPCYSSGESTCNCCPGPVCKAVHGERDGPVVVVNVPPDDPTPTLVPSHPPPLLVPPYPPPMGPTILLQSANGLNTDSDAPAQSPTPQDKNKGLSASYSSRRRLTKKTNNRIQEKLNIRNRKQSEATPAFRRSRSDNSSQLQKVMDQAALLVKIFACDLKSFDAEELFTGELKEAGIAFSRMDSEEVDADVFISIFGVGHADAVSVIDLYSNRFFLGSYRIEISFINKDDAVIAKVLKIMKKQKDSSRIELKKLNEIYRQQHPEDYEPLTVPDLEQLSYFRLVTLGNKTTLFFATQEERQLSKLARYLKSLLHRMISKNSLTQHHPAETGGVLHLHSLPHLSSLFLSGGMASLLDSVVAGWLVDREDHYPYQELDRLFKPEFVVCSPRPGLIQLDQPQPFVLSKQEDSLIGLHRQLCDQLKTIRDGEDYKVNVDYLSLKLPSVYFVAKSNAQKVSTNGAGQAEEGTGSLRYTRIANFGVADAVSLLATAYPDAFVFHTGDRLKAGGDDLSSGKKHSSLNMNASVSLTKLYILAFHLESIMIIRYKTNNEECMTADKLRELYELKEGRKLYPNFYGPFDTFVDLLTSLGHVFTLHRRASDNQDDETNAEDATLVRLNLKATGAYKKKSLRCTSASGSPKPDLLGDLSSGGKQPLQSSLSSGSANGGVSSEKSKRDTSVSFAADPPKLSAVGGLGREDNAVAVHDDYDSDDETESVAGLSMKPLVPTPSSGALDRSEILRRMSTRAARSLQQEEMFASRQAMAGQTHHANLNGHQTYRLFGGNSPLSGLHHHGRHSLDSGLWSTPPPRLADGRHNVLSPQASRGLGLSEADGWTGAGILGADPYANKKLSLKESLLPTNQTRFANSAQERFFRSRPQPSSSDAESGIITVDTAADLSGFIIRSRSPSPRKQGHQRNGFRAPDRRQALPSKAANVLAIFRDEQLEMMSSQLSNMLNINSVDNGSRTSLLNGSVVNDAPAAGASSSSANTTTTSSTTGDLINLDHNVSDDLMGAATSTPTEVDSNRSTGSSAAGAPRRSRMAANFF